METAYIITKGGLYYRGNHNGNYFTWVYDRDAASIFYDIYVVRLLVRLTGGEAEATIPYAL
jgi:hypothetical protein